MNCAHFIELSLTSYGRTRKTLGTTRRGGLFTSMVTHPTAFEQQSGSESAMLSQEQSSAPLMTTPYLVVRASVSSNTLLRLTAVIARLTSLRLGSSSRRTENDSFRHNPTDRARSEGIPPHNLSDYESLLCRNPRETARHAGDVIPRPVPFR